MRRPAAYLAQRLDLLGELNLGELVRRLFRCQALGRDRTLLVDAARVDSAILGQNQRVNAACNHLKCIHSFDNSWSTAHLNKLDVLRERSNSARLLRNGPTRMSELFTLATGENTHSRQVRRIVAHFQLLRLATAGP